MKLAKKSIPFDHTVITRASGSGLPSASHAPTLAAPILQLINQ
jgi:hypothetical protein